MSARRPPVFIITTTAVAGLALAMMADLGLLDGPQLRRGAVNTAVFVRELFPPSAKPLATLFDAMLETLQIAYVGTVLGFIGALPLAILATRTIFGQPITGPVRLLLAGVRTVPALLWAVVFVVAFGLGPAAGAMGIAAYTLGYLGKLLYEVLEGVDSEVVDAVWSVGCNRVQLTRFALLPEAANQILSQLLFVFEYNVRASSIMGFVGAGGIGFHLLGYLQLLQYQHLFTALLLTLGVVLLIDYASGRLRRLVLPPATAGRV